MGRPSKYKPEYCAHIINFFSVDPVIFKDMTVTTKDGTQIDKTVAEPSDLPFFSKWCRTIGITVETMMNWTETYPDFLDAYKTAKGLQEEILVTCGLRGLYSPAFAIFTAKNILGWRDERHLKGEGFASNTTNAVIFGEIDQERRRQLIDWLRAKRSEGQAA